MSQDQMEHVDVDVRHSYITGGTFSLKKVVYTAVDGLAIFEGDIVLGTVDQMEAARQAMEKPDATIQEGIAISGNQFRWPNGVIPFDIDPGLPNQQRVTDAINHLQTNTNLRLVARTSSHPNWITFRDVNGTCQSPVGMRGGQQFINLGPGCDWPRAVHEICHSAGLWHEQSREDRDSFVIINFSNIPPHLAHNFNQHITDGDDIGAYDYGSLMHYERNAFAINPAVNTITPTPDPTVAIGQRTGLSAGDIAAINGLYPGNVFPNWQLIDENPATIAIVAGGGNLYQLHNNGRIWRYLGESGATWEYPSPAGKN
jgi:astacin